MPIPFRDADEIDALGPAGYLKLDTPADESVVRGALLLINARGEPLEFTYNRVDTPNTFLWRKNDIWRHSVRELATSLLDACPKVPRFILCPAQEVPHELFCHEVLLSVPVCRLAPSMKATPHSTLEVEETLEDPEPLRLFWFPVSPPDGSIERRLFNRLAAGGLLTEPFERILVGLREVDGEANPEVPDEQRRPG